MNELPDYLPGQEPMYGVKLEADQYYQGSHITITASLTENGIPVNVDDYAVKAVVKSDLSSNKLVWQGFMNCGIFVENNELQIKIPRSTLDTMPSGTYFVAVVGKLKRDVNHVATLFTRTISLVASAASTLPIVIGVPINTPSIVMDSVIVPISYNF